ncbi:MAG: hypothetical protein ACU841_04450 [Gammaproteobacteria bacterium]
MDALATIAVEIQATFTGVLVIALIVILQIIDLRRAMRDHSLKMKELSDFSRSGERRPSWSLKKYRLISGFSLFLQFVFGLIVLAAFSCWTLYLTASGFRVAAVFSAVTALAGIAMPFVVWLTSRRRNREMERLVKETELRPRREPDTEGTPSAQAPESAAVRMEEDMPEASAALEPTVFEASPAPEPIARAAFAPKVPAIDKSARIPEDSMLRRHYLTHIESRKKPYEPARPTDSMLRRHYDALLASLEETVSKPAFEPSMAAGPLQGVEPESNAMPVVKKEISDKKSVPEDSMLRRHYLSALRYRLEAGLPPCPSDSMLKRHFETWKNELLARALEKAS